jgi:hypothetical protein
VDINNDSSPDIKSYPEGNIRNSDGLEGEMDLKAKVRKATEIYINIGRYMQVIL